MQTQMPAAPPAATAPNRPPRVPDPSPAPAVAPTPVPTPTPALLKKLAAVGADASAVPTLKRQMDGKAEALFLEGTAEGVTLADGLQKALVDALAALPIPKVMQYQLADGWSSVNFVRPAHGLVALHGADVVPVSVLGLAAGRQTRGHRFEAQMDPVVLLDADHYARQLEEQGGVIPGFAARHGELLRQLAVLLLPRLIEPDFLK